MTRYIVLYHMPPEAIAQMPDMTPEQMEEGMKPWMEWAERCGEALVDLGTPLANGQALVAAGSSPSTRGVAGYSIIEAESMDAAKALLAGHPHMTWNAACSIEVHETQPIPGM